jgi:hypothetical protein
MNLSVVYKFCDNVILLNESIYLLYTDSDIVFLQCIPVHVVQSTCI